MPLSSLAASLMTTLPDAETIRRKAAEVVARPEFQLDNDRQSESLSLFMRFLLWLLKPLRWFLELISGLPAPLWWLVVTLLVASLIAIVVHIVWSFYHAVTGTPRKKLAASLQDTRSTPEEMERAAAEAETNGDYIGAVRLWFRAGILRIERAEDRKLRRGLTNHELLRRYRTSPLFEPLKWFVQTIDAKWYGYEDCQPEDCALSKEEYARICRFSVRRPHAVGA